MKKTHLPVCNCVSSIHQTASEHLVRKTELYQKIYEMEAAYSTCVMAASESLALAANELFVECSVAGIFSDYENISECSIVYSCSLNYKYMCVCLCVFK